MGSEEACDLPDPQGLCQGFQLGIIHFILYFQPKSTTYTTADQQTQSPGIRQVRVGARRGRKRGKTVSSERV